MTEFEKFEEKERLRRGYSDSYFSAMKRRLNLQMIGAYIRAGDTKLFVSNDSLEKRKKETTSRLERLIEEKCGEEAENIIEEINAYSSVIEEIYFNLGMKAGAILQCKLTDNFETEI